MMCIEKRFLKTLAVAGAVLFLAASCSDGDSEAAADEFLSEKSGLVTADGVDTGEFGKMWEKYLVEYDKVLTDGSSAENLDDVAVDSVVDALADEGEVNAEKVEESKVDGVETVSSQSGLVSFDDSSDKVVLRDCTTHKTKVLLGEVFEIYADREVVFTKSDDGWLISDVVVIQDGWFSEDFGCVPSDISDEAVRVAQVFQRGVVEFERDPSEPLSDELLAVTADEMLEPLEVGRSEMASLGYFSDSVVELSFVSEGLNFRFSSLEGPVVRVVSCAVYPEGQVVMSRESGEVVDEGVGVGGSVATSVDVIVRDGLAGEVIGVSSVEGGC